MIASAVILGAVTVERAAELLIARRNTLRLLAGGAIEHSPGQYPTIVAVHAAWLAGLWWLAWDRTTTWGWLAIFLALQGLRGWVLATLGRRWTTRILVVPGERLVRRGPYRLLRHPNYVVVAGEIAVLPLVFGLPMFALVFSGLNAVVLAMRIRAEDAALATLTSPPVDVAKPA